MLLFNNGQNSKIFPKFYIETQELKYVEEVNFLGVYFTRKLNWKRHINYLIQKAMKSCYLIRVISKNSWGQDTKLLINLACTLVRSQLSFGQVAFFCAYKTYLKKLQSLDSKVFKLALGVPIDTKTKDAYAASVLSLEDYRKLACAKYVIRSHAVENNMQEDLNTRSDIDFPKRTKDVISLQTISTYIQDIFNDANILPHHVAPKIINAPYPIWEMESAQYDINCTNFKKHEHPHLIATEAR